MSRAYRHALLLLLCIMVGMTIGCSSDIPRGVVRGHVNLDGKPVEQCELVFKNSDASINFNSFVIDGAFEAKGYKGGIPTGSYRVSVHPAVKDLPEYSFDPGDIEKIANQSRQATYVVNIPKRYQSLDNSPFSIDVKEGDNQLNIELKSE